MVSSGQARVIALTARINDIEFQGQQINQQRTTLANKSSEFYNSMLDMNVPTPPSKTDFTKIVYKGVQSASKFKIENVLPTQDGKYNIRLGYEQQGLAMKKSTSGLIVSNTVAEFSANQISDKDITDLLSTDAKDVTIKPGVAYTGQTAGAEKGDTDVLVQVSAKDYKAWATGDGKNAKPLGLYNNNGKPVKDVDNLSDTDVVYVRCNMADLKSSGNAFQKLAPKFSEGDNAGEIDWSKIHKIDSETATQLKSSLDDAAVVSMRLYTGTPGGKATKITTVEELQNAIDNKTPIFKRCSDSEAGNAKFSNPDYQEGKDNYSVDDIPLVNMKDAVDLLGDSYSSFITALHHSFPEIKEDEIAESFYVYKDADNTFKFIKKESINSMKDQSSVTSYVYDESGTYTEHKDTKGCELKFDTNTGRILEIGIPDGNGKIQYIEVTAEEATDDEAYETAYNEYEYDKYLYDKKQNDINAQLSIIQAEDRNLELKLTRLDNERNALNTELEACKKVVKEGTERGAKTFNG